MPRISDIQSSIEKKIDLSPFFGEEAFITIKKIPVYTYKLLLNRNRRGFTARYYELLEQRKEELNTTELPVDEYLSVKRSIPPDESAERMSIEEGVDKDFYSQSILSDKHNFTDDEGKLVELHGSWFYTMYSGLVDKDGMTLNDKIISEIMIFNNSGIRLGERIHSK